MQNDRMLDFVKNLLSFHDDHRRNIWLDRNDPCWCGSGQKYKKCHMTADEPLRRKHQALQCGTKG